MELVKTSPFFDHRLQPVAVDFPLFWRPPVPLRVDERDQS